MHGDRESESGGAPITPSARPGIHDHRNHPLKTVDEMGRYGLNNQTRPRDSDAQAHNSGDEGRDEVDNVQSKFLHTSSPVNARRIDVKRKSVELTHSPFKDEDSCHTSVLAKSLPPSLPSYSHSRDDEFRGLELISHYESNNSRNFQCIPESARHDRSLYESSLGTPLQSRQHADQETASQQSFGIKGMLVLAVLAMLAALYYGYFPISEIVTLSPANNYYNSAKFYNEMNYLRERYKITDNSILKLQTGISTILKRQDTGSFVFAYKSNNENFDPEEFDNFMNTVASIAAKYLRNDSTQVRHIVVDGSKLEMRSHSELINKYREEVTKTGVMLVRDLDEVPSILAMAFHYYCDEYNPLVKKSAIFFTLDMAKCSHNPVEQKPTHALIEKCLQKKWSGVPKDNIRPLLNRVVSTVVDLGGD